VLSQTTARRLLDVAVAACALVALAPVIAVIALAIRLESRGPVIFRQRRLGRGLEPFTVLKFRTMSDGADATPHRDYVHSLIQRPAGAERGQLYKLSVDNRVTRVGRFLRSWSLDELPQLVNVLKGDMSIVGPRPEQIDLVRRYRPEHRFRLAVKPGMTGPMQVYGRGALEFSERLAVELDYVENLSLSRDLRILFHTLPAIFRGTGAY
jgi:lipopolysaccharide/colanic/teichoic acid biosynthesis glycosyltransferase